MQKILLFLFTFILTCLIKSQTGTVSGNIKYNNGKYASSIVLKVKENGKTTVSDSKGNYSLSLPYGNYQLELYSKHVEKKIVSIRIDAPQLTHNFSITESHFDNIEEVVIQKQSEKEAIEKRGFAVNVIEMKEASLQNIQTNELLERSAGIKIRQDGGLGSHIHYNINGMTGSSVKIFIDGVPSTNFGQSFSLNSIPPALIERIEVYKGVVPSYLSEDALGGAINVILKKSKKNSLNTSYSFGSFNTHQFAVNGSYRDKGGFFTNLSSFYNYSDNDYKVWGNDIRFRDYNGNVTYGNKARRFHDAYRSYGTKIDIGWNDVKWADNFSIGGIFSDDYKEIQNGITMDNVFGDRHSRRNANVATLNYLKKDLFFKGLTLKTDASYSFLKTQVIDSVGIIYDWRGPILDGKGKPMMYSGGAELGNKKTAEINKDIALAIRANLSYAIGTNNTFHVNYLFNNFDRSISDQFLALGEQMLLNTRDLQKNIFAVTYENTAFSKRLRTNFFYKYYQQKVTANAPYKISSNPDIYGLETTVKKEDRNGFGGTLSFSVLPKLVLLGSAEKAIRFPNAREIFGSPAEAINPANLKAESSFNANLGIIIGPYIFGRNSLRVNTSLFYRNTKDMIRQAIEGGNRGNSYYENLEDVLTKGIDAEINYSYDNKILLNFTISKFDVLFNTKYDKDGSPYLYYRDQIRNEPSFKFNSNLSYYIKDFLQNGSMFSVSYNMSYVNGFLRNWSNVGLNNLEKIPKQFSNDIGMLYTFPNGKITLSFDAKNILNRQIFDNFGLQKPGRSFFGKISYTIL